MIKPDYFVQTLISAKIDFFAGVPDSTLKNFCAYITENVPPEKHWITANEGAAIAMAAGHYLATEQIAAVYMQNSGLGNAINPLLSLIDPAVYNIPVLLLIGWRGAPSVKDEPQHITQGRLTIPLLQTLEIEHTVLDVDSKAAEDQICSAIQYMKQTLKPYAFLIRKDTFALWQMHYTTNTSLMTREQALEVCLKYVSPTDIIIATTGLLSRELFELREKKKDTHEQDFLMVGSMGHAIAIACAIAVEKKK